MMWPNEFAQWIINTIDTTDEQTMAAIVLLTIIGYLFAVVFVPSVVIVSVLVKWFSNKGRQCYENHKK